MAVDEGLAQRFRDALDRRDGLAGRLTEKRMMGGLCFLLDGGMIGGVDRTKEGVARFMFRVGKPNDATAAAMTGAEPMIQGGRRMSGLFFVREDAMTEPDLERWLALAIGFVETPPPKTALAGEKR